MNKRELHHLLVRLRPLSYWYFLILFIISLSIGLLAMRQNNITALQLRDKVLEVDKQNGNVEAALRDLRTHVYTHMNSGLAQGDTAIKPPVQLKYRYERLMAAEKERVSSQNEKIYNDAQNDCERRFPTGLSGGSRIPCIEQYVAAHGIREQPIPDDLYKFDFVSPVWSPDLAGFSLLLSGLFGAMFVIRFGLEKWLIAKSKE
jgi:hypothetical protein